MAIKDTIEICSMIQQAMVNKFDFTRWEDINNDNEQPMKNYLKIVRIDAKSMKPKYRQVIDAIIYGVETEQICDGDHLPSIHDFCVALDVSKNVIEKAYNELKVLGFISSYQGKGHFVQRVKAQHEVHGYHELLTNYNLT